MVKILSLLQFHRLQLRHEKKKLLIICAGLSGLYSAVLLQDIYKVTIIEARDRTGGRIMGIDATHFTGKLIFSGTESAFQKGGCLEGAMYAAKCL